MHQSGRDHLLRFSELCGTKSQMDLSLKPFQANAADAYCYYVALGLTRGVDALRVMSPADAAHGNFHRRFQRSFNKLKAAVGKDFSVFELSSLEAYLLSPLMDERPKLIRRSRAKRPKESHAKSSGAASAIDLDPIVELGAQVEPQLTFGMAPEPASEPAAEPQECAVAALEATPMVEEAASWTASVAAEAAVSKMATPLVELNEPTIRLGGVYKVKKDTRPGFGGHQAVGMACARITKIYGDGVFEATHMVQSVNLRCGQKRKVYECQLVPLVGEPKTLDDHLYWGHGRPNHRYRRALAKAYKLKEAAEARAVRADFKRKVAEARLKTAEGKLEAERALNRALFAGGPKNDPRISRAGRNLIEKLRNLTKEGQLTRQLEAAKKTIDRLKEENRGKLAQWEREKHLKGRSLARERALKEELKKAVGKLAKSDKKVRDYSKANINDWPEDLRDRYLELQVDAAVAGEMVEELANKVETLEKKLATMLKQKVGKHTGVDLGAAIADEPCDAPAQPLWKMLGKPCTEYSQDIVELGLSLMAQRLSAPQAVGVMRAFLLCEYPDKVEGKDYRIPSEARFREWRRFL